MKHSFFATFTLNSTFFTTKQFPIQPPVLSFSQRGEGCFLTSRIITSLTSRFIDNGWISEEDTPFFQYALDSFIGKTVFFVLLTIICVILHCFKEALIFSIVFLAFRSRMGGWHANSRWLCQLLSIGIVIVSSCILGPQFEKLHISILVSLNLSAIVISFFLSPAYPPQLHLSQDEIKGNIYKKNQLLIVLILIQLPLIFLLDYRILSYTSLGLILGICLVFIERITQNKRKG